MRITGPTCGRRKPSNAIAVASVLGTQYSVLSTRYSVLSTGVTARRSVLRHLRLNPAAAEFLHHRIDSIEHHPQLAADGEELPAFLNALEHFVRARTVE